MKLTEKQIDELTTKMLPEKVLDVFRIIKDKKYKVTTFEEAKEYLGKPLVVLTLRLVNSKEHGFHLTVPSGQKDLWITNTEVQEYVLLNSQFTTLKDIYDYIAPRTEQKDNFFGEETIWFDIVQVE